MLLKVVILKNKSIFFIIAILLIPIILIGCTYSINRKKPNNFYYTNLLAKNLTISSSCTGTAIDTNFYKKQNLTTEDLDTIKKLTKALSKKNFIAAPKDLPKKPIYKIILEFNDEKYVINIYNEKYLSIYPWDGSYNMDYLDITNIERGYNVYYLCKYLIPE